MSRPRDDEFPLRHTFERRAQATDLELLLQRFGLGLTEQQIARVVLAKHFVEQARTRLHVTCRFALARISREHQARDARDLAKTALREFARIERREDVFEQMVGRQQSLGDQPFPVERLGRQQFETVVVHRNRERAGLLARGAPRKQRAQTDVHDAATEGVAKKVMAFVRLDQLAHQAAGLGQRRPALLQFEQRPDRAHLGLVPEPRVVGMRGPMQHVERRVGQLTRQRHAAA